MDITTPDAELLAQIRRIADALERMVPVPATQPDFEAAEAFVWSTAPERFAPVAKINRVFNA